MTMMKRVAVNECGRRVGQDHHKARLTDHEVELMRRMHYEEKLGYRRLSQIWEIPRATVQGICNYTRRVDVATRWKTVEVAA